MPDPGWYNRLPKWGQKVWDLVLDVVMVLVGGKTKTECPGLDISRWLQGIM